MFQGAGEAEGVPLPQGGSVSLWPKIGVWKSKTAMCEIPEGGEVATQTKFGKRLLLYMVAVVGLPRRHAAALRRHGPSFGGAAGLGVKRHCC